jgi:hypothetical protein
MAQPGGNGGSRCGMRLKLTGWLSKWRPTLAWLRGVRNRARARWRSGHDEEGQKMIGGSVKV